MILESEDGSKLLIDCGTDARHSLHELGLSYKDIEHVYISHLHADHAGGLEWLGFSRSCFIKDLDEVLHRGGAVVVGVAYERGGLRVEPLGLLLVAAHPFRECVT